MLRTLGLGGLHLSEIDLQRPEAGACVDLVATITAEGVPDSLLEQAVQRLAAEPGLLRVRWQPLDEA